ncbi:MAG: Asp-tRNA(Asn)/Glu-tRNA(Gln) amidotransferase subunit GatB [Candidatus Babeliales bacterium]
MNVHSNKNEFSDYESVIGMEVHVQLQTQSKIFCKCKNGFSEIPNQNICPVCTGHPGILPVLNQKVSELALRLAVALQAEIAHLSFFDRKHYFYPDLPKNYQITQNDIPFCSNGFVPIRIDNKIKKIKIKRIHIEEDAGKNIHIPDTQESYVNLDRAGTPLLEIVTYPDLQSPHEAKLFLKSLFLIVKKLELSSLKMEEGAFRADANISVRKINTTELGTKCEIKNVNSFNFIFDALEYEHKRQVQALLEGQTLRQETRLWDPKKKATFTMRTKETTADYRFVRDPDLPPLSFSQEQIAASRKNLPELPDETLVRLMKQFNLSLYHAELMIEHEEFIPYFEKAYASYSSDQLIHWIVRDIMGYLKEHTLPLSDFRVTPLNLATLVRLLDEGKINQNAAKTIFVAVATTGADPQTIMKEQGLTKIDSPEQLEPLIKQIVENNPDKVAAFRAGKERLLGFFIGQIMKETNGNADPEQTQELLKKYLSQS